ncbi:hypothetical protein Tco_0896141 [Tanacetum coccineum]
MIMVLKTSHHGPSDAMHNPYQLLRLLSKEVCFISHGDQHASIGFFIPISLILKSIHEEFEKVTDSDIDTPYLKTLKNSRPLPDFEECTSLDDEDDNDLISSADGVLKDPVASDMSALSTSFK